jgi:fucose permease
MTYVFINALDLSEFMARVLAAAGSIDYLVFSFLAWFVIERYGRRRVMMVSAAACAACWTLISIAASQIEQGKGNRFSWGCTAIFGFFAFFAAFGMGVLAVPWLYPTEVNALAFRAKGASLAMASNW